MHVLSFWTERTRPTALLPWITTKCKPCDLAAHCYLRTSVFHVFSRTQPERRREWNTSLTLCKVSWPCKFLSVSTLTQTHTHQIVLTHILTKIPILFHLCTGLISIWWGLSRKTMSIFYSLSELPLCLSLQRTYRHKWIIKETACVLNMMPDHLRISNFSHCQGTNSHLSFVM